MIFGQCSLIFNAEIWGGGGAAAKAHVLNSWGGGHGSLPLAALVPPPMELKNE